MPRGIDTGRLQLFPIENYTIHVTDGDSLLLVGGGKKVSVRLAGIDTPEVPKSNAPQNYMQGLGQTGNLLGRRFLEKIINENRHSVQLWIVPGKKSHGRVVGYVTVGERNINLELVELGLARALTNPTSSTYTPAMDTRLFKSVQETAIKERRGIFRSPFHRALVEQTADVGGLSYVRMTTPEMLSESFDRRVRARRILQQTYSETKAGMAQGDHTKSTYGGFVGMNLYRPDFGASNTPFNPHSTATIANMLADRMMREIREDWEKKGLKGEALDRAVEAESNWPTNKKYLEGLRGAKTKLQGEAALSELTTAGFSEEFNDLVRSSQMQIRETPEVITTLQKMYSKLGLRNKDLLMGIDIETSGAAASSHTTFGGVVDVSAGDQFQFAIDPKLPYRKNDPAFNNATQYTQALFGTNYKQLSVVQRRRMANAAKLSGGQLVGSGPKGERLTRAWQEEQIRTSEMPNSLKPTQLEALKTHRSIQPEEFMDTVFDRFKQKKTGWVFMHNATFESDRLGPAISEKLWQEGLEQGYIASGYEGRRTMFNTFDAKLGEYKNASYRAMQSGDHTEVAKQQSVWLDRFYRLFTGAEEPVQGVKFVDTMDIAKGVFAQAKLANHFQKDATYSVHGLLAQDTISTLMGLAPEEHMPVPDAQQNLYVVGKLLEYHKELASPKGLGEEGRAFFKKAETLHSDLSLFSLYKDIAGQIRGAESTKAALEFNVPIRGDVATMKPVNGIKRIGGVRYEIDGGVAYTMEKDAQGNYARGKVANIMQDAYPDYDSEFGTAVQYAEKRLKTLGINDTTPEELVTRAYEYRHVFNELPQNEVINMISGKDYKDLKSALQDRHIAMPMAATEAMMAKKLKPKGKVPGKGFVVGEWFDSLHPTTKGAAAGIGGIAAAFGVLGMIRGFSEKRRNAQPEAMYSMEEYAAMKQQGVHNNHQDGDLSSMMASYRMVPNRYPTKG